MILTEAMIAGYSVLSGPLSLVYEEPPAMPGDTYSLMLESSAIPLAVASLRVNPVDSLDIAKLPFCAFGAIFGGSAACYSFTLKLRCFLYNKAHSFTDATFVLV